MTVYTPEFFGSLRQSSRTSAEVIVPLVFDRIEPRSVVDVGCGSGEWADVARRKGLSDYLGVDGSYGDHTTIDASHFLERDLTRALDLGRTFDLVISLEVAEHLPIERSEGFIEDLVTLAPAVLFSAAIPGQGGVGHVNEQWQSWWAHQFARHGYAAHDVVRPHVWNDDRVAVWYRQNTILYRRDSSPTTTVLDIVHPRTFEKSREIPGLRRSLALLPEAAWRSIKKRRS